MVEMRVIMRPRLARRIGERYANELDELPWEVGPVASRRQLDEQQITLGSGLGVGTDGST